MEKEIGIEFLNFVYTREDSSHPLIHLPDILKTDNPILKGIIL